MLNRQGQDSTSRDTVAATDEPSAGSSEHSTTGSGPYHPSRVFRALIPSSGTRPRAESRRGRRRSSVVPRRGASVLSAAIAVGVAAGVLELGVLFAQVRGLQLVDWSTLMISRHAAWMIPATGTGLACCWRSSWCRPCWSWRPCGSGGGPKTTCRARRGIGPGWSWAPCCSSARCWRSGGCIRWRRWRLGGRGLPDSRLIVRPTPRWRRRIHGAAAIGAAVLALLVLTQSPRARRSAARTAAGPAAGLPASSGSSWTRSGPTG